LGYSVEASLSRGWDAHGIDISEYAIEHAKRTGLGVMHGDFLECAFSRDYDLITAWDTIEHVVSPGLFFQQAFQSLKEGGILALTTPDCTAASCRLWGRRWFEYKWPEHIFYLSRQTVTRYCHRLGFDVLLLEQAIKYKPLPDAITRWLGLYESGRWLHSILGWAIVPYTSLSEVILIAQKRIV
jgi:SAM-dependent methyltransferase